jgi:hypothetical protein
MTNADAEGKRGEAPTPDDATTGDSAGAGPPAQRAPAGGVAVPPQRASDRPGYGGIEEAGLGGGSGDLGAGGDLSGDVGRLDEDEHNPDA